MSFSAKQLDPTTWIHRHESAHITTLSIHIGPYRTILSLSSPIVRFRMGSYRPNIGSHWPYRLPPAIPIQRNSYFCFHKHSITMVKIKMQKPRKTNCQASSVMLPKFATHIKLHRHSTWMCPATSSKVLQHGCGPQIARS